MELFDGGKTKQKFIRIHFRESDCNTSLCKSTILGLEFNR
jgi:hypothetical protein